MFLCRNSALLVSLYNQFVQYILALEPILARGVESPYIKRHLTSADTEMLLFSTMVGETAMYVQVLRLKIVVTFLYVGYSNSPITIGFYND